MKQNKYNEQKIIIDMVDVNPVVSIIALNVDGLNIQIKRPINRLSNHYEIHFKYKDSDMLSTKVWKKIYHANTKQKKARMILLILNTLQEIFRRFT